MLESDFKSTSNDEAVIKIVGKLCTEFKELEENLQKQIKVRNVIETVLYNYDVITKETNLVASDIEDKIRMYLAVKKLDGLSPLTLYNYNLNLLKLAEILRKPINSITTNDLRMYLAYTCKDKKPSTTNTKISMLKSFFTWLVNEEYITKNPMSKIKQTKVNKKLRGFLNQEELEILRENCITLREKALFEFLFSTGCRLDEIYKTNINNINWNERSLHVIGKGTKERIVYFTVKSKIYLQNYLKSRKDNISALFVTSKKPYHRLGKRSIEREVNKISNRAGFTKSVFPHLLRHSMATAAINNGISITTVQKLLGHESPETTLIYADLNQETVKNEYKKLY
ncbi:integrase [Clostridium botulinum]|nr:integrase [Clostridium botulinum]